MIVLLVASASLALAVTPTTVPTMAFSSTALAVAFDVGHSTHVEFVHVADRDGEDAGGRRGVGGGGPDRDVVAPRRLAIDAAGHRDQARVASIVKRPPASSSSE